MVLFAEVVLVEQSSPDTRNAHKNSLASWSLNFFLFQWCIWRTWFQLGSRPGITKRKIGSDKGVACVWESNEEFIFGHALNTFLTLASSSASFCLSRKLVGDGGACKVIPARSFSQAISIRVVAGLTGGVQGAPLARDRLRRW